MTAGTDALHVVRQAGSGPRLVVVHGAMDRSVSFGRMVRLLPDREVVRYDRRGYARSRSLGPGDLSSHVDDLVSVMGSEPTVLLGHSVGGVISLVAATRPGTPVVGVVAYEPPMPWKEWWPRPARPTGADDGAGTAADEAGDAADEAEAFMRRMIGDRMWRRLPSSTRADRRAEGVALRADIASVSGDVPPFDPGAVQVPVSAVAGTGTTWYHRRAAEELAAAVPTGELVLLKGASHGGHLTHPAELAGVVATFIDGLT